MTQVEDKPLHAEITADYILILRFPNFVNF